MLRSRQGNQGERGTRVSLINLIMGRLEPDKPEEMDWGPQSARQGDRGKGWDSDKPRPYQGQRGQGRN